MDCRKERKRRNHEAKTGDTGTVFARGQILALTSSKGGVGKSHLAVGLSAALAKRTARVLLIDGDLGNGIISDRLEFHPKYTLAHFFLKDRALRDLIEETPFGFSLIAGERGNLALANLNYPQEMKFLRSFIGVSRNFDFVVLDLASGIKRQAVDFALLAEKTILVTSPDDLTSAYGSVQACFSRFMELEAGLFRRIEGYTPRRFFRPLILTNHVTNLYQGEGAFEALKNAVKKGINSAAVPFGIKMDHLGSVFHDPGLFEKSEERRCPVSLVSVYSKVAICVDSIAGTICARSPFRSFYEEQRLRYIVQVLMEHQQWLSKGLTRKATKVSLIRIPHHH
jgi:MinD-like ATPase involved in chromosome partitioning or flagellar assembly